jgi:cell division protein FtsW
MQKILSHVKGDKVIWIIALLLSALSLLAVYSAVSSLVWGGGGSSISHLVKHGFMLMLGFAVMYLIHLVPLNYISRFAQLFIWIAIILLIMTLMFGSNINNADRWLRIPGLGLTIQTSDFAKLILLTYIARQLTVKRNELKDFKKGVLPIVIPIAIVCGLIFPANFSTSALLGFVCMIMLIIGGVPWKHIFKLLAMLIGLLVFVVLIGEFGPDKILPRYDTWKNRIFKKEVQAGKIDDSDYQIELAKFAIHEGGIIPKGPGSGSSRNFLPHPYSDMIFAFVIEEYGSVIGGFSLVFLYVIFLFRVIRTSVRSPKQFGALAAMGLGLMITVQAFVNMAVAVDLIPTTGQPLPMVSMGGTSIIFTFMMFGIILAISKLEPEKDETEIFE